MNIYYLCFLESQQEYFHQIIFNFKVHIKMLKFSYEHYLTNYKFHSADIFSISPKTVLITLISQIECQQELVSVINSYIFSEGKMLKHLPQFRILDVKKESQQIIKIAVFNKKGLKGDVFQPFVQSWLVQKIDNELYQLRIIDQRKGIAISYDQKKLQLINFKGDQNSSQTIKTIYNLSFRESNGLLSTVSLLDSLTALFHISIDDSRNNILSCIDIQYQSISWKQVAVGHNFMLNTVVKVHQKAFLNGNINAQMVGSLKLYDIRVKGNVLNVLDLDDEIFQSLQSQWNRTGLIQSNFNHIHKSTKPFQIVGMISFRAQTYNFPYILDLRRPNHIVPLNYPNGKYINHIKTFEVVDSYIIAIERFYNNFTLKQSNICSYQIDYSA